MSAASLVPMSESLPSLMGRAGQRLIEAKSSAEVLEAKQLAELALHYAKVTKAANETHADCLRIIARAEIRMANEIDRGRANGEIQQHGKVDVRSPDITLSDLGVSRQRVSEWREVRDAGEAVIETAISRALSEGRAPTKSEILQAANKIKADQKRTDQEERRTRVEQAALDVPEATHRYRLLHAPLTDLLEEPRGSVDVICTDPPYPREFLPAFDTLGAVAAHLLKPGGVLVCMSGQTYLPEVIASLARHLDYRWTLAYLTPGGQATQIFPRKINTFWKPILVFGNGDCGDDWIGDVTKSDVNDNDKNHHEWGQSISGMTDLMKRFVRRGHVVVDPFLGGGTTALVALDLGATFIGCDIDEHAIKTTKARLASANLV